MGFSKLFSSITDSTIWRQEDHTRLVWITMLAICNKNGYVFASVPGLSDRARVPLESTVKALNALMAPDQWSRTKDFEGRRVEEVDGGWRIVNYLKYRAIRDEEDRREYMREYMANYRKQSVNNVSQVNRRKPILAHTDADADADADKSKVKSVAPVGARKRATRIPEDFVPTQEHYALAKELGIIMDMEFPRFRDYYLGISGSKGLKLDWDATLRNWLRNSVNYAGNGKPREREDVHTAFLRKHGVIK